MSAQSARSWVLLIAGVAALVYAFIPPTNPVWIGIAGTLLGSERLNQARGETIDDVKKPANQDSPDKAHDT